MASRETNNAKREVMAGLLAELLGAKGWSPTTLALQMGVSSSNVSSWKLGKNMGTNDQRAVLAKLPSYADGKAALLDELKARIARAEEALAKVRAEEAAHRAQVKAEAKNGFWTRINDWDWTRSDYYAVLMANPETGDYRENVVQVYKQSFFDRKPGDIESETQTGNLFCDWPYRVAGREKDLKARKADLAKFQKVEGK